MDTRKAILLPDGASHLDALQWIAIIEDFPRDTLGTQVIELPPDFLEWLQSISVNEHTRHEWEEAP